MHQLRNTECQFNICQFGHRNSSLQLISLQLSNSCIFGLTITEVEHVNKFADIQGLKCEFIYPWVPGRQNVRREMRRRIFTGPYTFGWVIVWSDCLVLYSSAFILTIFHSLSMAWLSGHIWFSHMCWPLKFVMQILLLGCSLCITHLFIHFWNRCHFYILYWDTFSFIQISL